MKTDNKAEYIWEQYNMNWIEYVKYKQSKDNSTNKISSKSTWKRVSDKIKK